MIPFQDLGRLHNSIRAELDTAIGDVVERSAFVGAASCRSFEAAFAEAHGAAHAVGCGSGTDALTLALVAAGVGPGDEVIVPSMTFIATAEAVVHAGATPVLADVTDDSLLLDPVDVDAVRTDRTRAVLPVHLYGNLLDPGVLQRWRADGLVVVEDAAQAHLGRHGATGVGAVGNAACFSFYPGKNLGAFGDGGAVLTDDAQLAAEIRLLRHHGMRELYVHERVATNSRMSEVEAAVLRVGLAHLPAWNARRRDVARRYREAAPHLAWHADHPRHVHHLCVLRIADRAAFARSLPAATAVHYPLAVTQQPAYRHFTRTACPRAEAWATECLTLPCFPELRDDEVDRVCEALAAVPSDREPLS